MDATEAKRTPSYSKRAKDLVTAEEATAIVRAHLTRVYRAILLRVAVAVVIWTAIVVGVVLALT